MTGYKEINYRAMRLLPRGGVSGHLLLQPLRHGGAVFEDAALGSQGRGVQLRQIEARQQCCDHPFCGAWRRPITEILSVSGGLMNTIRIFFL